MTRPAPAGDRDATSPALLVTLDLGSATTAAALVGRVGGRRRLLAAAALPGGSDPDTVVGLLRDRVRSADPELAASLGIEDGPGPSRATPARLVSRTVPPPRVAVVAATEQARAQLEAIAGAAGWLTAGASAARKDPLAIVRLATRAGIGALLVGTADPPDADERGLLEELTAVAGAVAARQPGIPVILAGGVGRTEPVPHRGLRATRREEVQSAGHGILAPRQELGRVRLRDDGAQALFHLAPGRALERRSFRRRRRHRPRSSFAADPEIRGSR